MAIWLCMILIMVATCCHGYNWSSLNLPESNIPYFFTNNPDVRDQCKEDNDCPFKLAVEDRKCWGYEKDCPPEQRMSSLYCPEDVRGMKKEDQMELFWKSADFGHVSSNLREMKTICRQVEKGDSLLECSEKTHYCRAKNLYLDFRNVQFQGEIYHDDFLAPGDIGGDIGGHCELDDQPLRDQERKSLSEDERHFSESGQLQSWIQQLKNYRSLPFKANGKDHCDFVIDKPIIFIKMNSLSGNNLYHHFCDFINLYISQHINNSFSMETRIVDWNEGASSAVDRFEDVFKVFSLYPVIQLRMLQNKTVCFKDVMFPLPPNMIKGMFFNMGLISGCYGSSLFKAFSEHILHRLQIKQQGPHIDKVRITFLVRGGDYRKTLNKEKLFAALKQVDGVEATFSEFETDMLPFMDQMKVAHNSDVFIGVHGAGLTHMLFQPDWGAVIELHNCSDPAYNDLSRFRGLKYFTLPEKDQFVQHIKCKTDVPHGDRNKCSNKESGLQRQSDYSFKVDAFIDLATRARNYVNSHPLFIAARERRHGRTKENGRKVEL